jgi:hypothetical protein
MTQLSMELYLWRYLLGCELYFYFFIFKKILYTTTSLRKSKKFKWKDIYTHTHKYSQINQELCVLISEKKTLNDNSK